jgi:hypothetical protein
MNQSRKSRPTIMWARTVPAVPGAITLYLQRPSQFWWAGMGKMAGGAVFNGLTDPGFLGSRLGSGNLGKSLRVAFVYMGKAIFDDLAWQHVAYRDGGLAEIHRIAQTDPMALDSGAVAAWEDIDSQVRCGYKLGIPLCCSESRTRYSSHTMMRCMAQLDTQSGHCSPKTRSLI